MGAAPLIGATEHFDKFHQSLVGQAGPPESTVGIRVVLGEVLQRLNVRHPVKNILIVFVARLCLGRDGNLFQY